MDENSIDVARKWKFSHIYDKLDEPARKKIKMDEVALFSVTKESDSEVMVNLLTKYLPHTALVTDGCACVGGNTSYFAKYFNRVKAYEIDPERYKLLLNNLEVYGVNKKCECYNEDFTKVIDGVHEDLVFLDPPWGGEDYLTHASLELEMSGLTTKEIVSKLRGHTRYIYLKVPQNFDFKAIYDYNKDIIELEKQSFMISSKKGTFYYTVLMEFNDPNNGIIWNSFPRTECVNNRKQINIENLRIDDLETNDNCKCYCGYINSLLSQYSYNTTILDISSSSMGLLFIYMKKVLDQPNTLIGIEKNQIKMKCSIENYEKYYPNNKKNKYPVRYYTTIADYLSNNNNNNNNNESSKEFIIFHHLNEETKIKTVVPAIIEQYINQITFMIIVINEKLSDININNILPSGFTSRIDSYEMRGKKCYFLLVYKTQNYFVKNEILINCFSLNNGLKQLVKDFLNLRYNKLCKEFEGFTYQNLKDLSIENSKNKSSNNNNNNNNKSYNNGSNSSNSSGRFNNNNNNNNRKNIIPINLDEKIMKSFKTNYENDSTIKEIYLKSESSKLPPYILGRPVSKVERIYEMVKEQNPTIVPKNILIIGVLDCDLSKEIHNKYPSSKITSIDIIKTYKPLYGSYSYHPFDIIDFKMKDNNSNVKYDIIIIQSLHHYLFHCLLIDNLRDKLDDNGYVVLCEMHCNDSTVSQFYQFLHLFHYHFLMNIDCSICSNNGNSFLFRPISDWTMLLELCQYDLLKSYPSVVSYYTLMMQIYKKREKISKKQVIIAAVGGTIAVTGIATFLYRRYKKNKKALEQKKNNENKSIEQPSVDEEVPERVVESRPSVASTPKDNSAEIEQLKQEGLKLFKSGKYEDAIKAFTALLEMPNSTDKDRIFYNRGTCNEYLKKYEEAIQDLTQAVQINREYSKAFQKRAKCYEILNQLEDALVDYNIIYIIDLIHEKQDIPPQIEKISFEVGRKRAAETILRRKETESVTYEFPQEHAIRVYLSGFTEPIQHETPTETLEELNEMIGLDSDNGDLYYNRAVIYLNQKNYIEAEQDFRFALELDSQNKIKSLLQLTIFSIVKCNFLQAQVYVDQGLKLTNNNESEEDEKKKKYYKVFLYFNAQIKFETNKSSEGLELSNQLRDKYPDYPDVYLQIAQYYFIREECDKCKENLNKAIELYPNCGMAYFQLALIAVKTANYIDGKVNFEKAIKLIPDLGYIYNFYSEFLFSTNELNLAFKMVETGIEKDPTFPLNYLTKAAFISQTDPSRQNEVNDLYKKALDIDPTCVASYEKLAMSFLMNMQCDDAIRYLNKAVTYCKNDAELEEIYASMVSAEGKKAALDYASKYLSH